MKKLLIAALLATTYSFAYGAGEAITVYKDKECRYEYGDGSSGNEDYWLAHADCEIRFTEQRIAELKGRPSCTGGNSVCTPHMR